MQVLIVDDRLSAHDVLTAVLRQAFTGVAIHSEKTLEGAIAKVRSANRFDLVLLDLGVPGWTGIEALTHFRGTFPRCRIVAFSPIDDRASILAVLKAGAAGYLPKTCSRKLMIAALRFIAAGGRYLPPEILPDAELMPHQVRVAVTARQRDVLRLLMKGYGNQRIASELEISQSTVKQHAHAVFDAVGVSSRAQLLATVVRRGLHVD